MATYNAAALKSGTRSGVLPMASRPQGMSTDYSRHPTCGWRVSWSLHWYGSTVRLNGCLVDWLAAVATAIGALTLVVAAIQAGLDIPADVAAILGALAVAAGAVMFLHWLTCEDWGYGGVTYNRRLGIFSYPGCWSV